MKLKQSQKVRVIANNVSFYATVKDIKNGVGAYDSFNQACIQGLKFIEDNNYQGYVGKIGDYILQMDI